MTLYYSTQYIVSTTSTHVTQGDSNFQFNTHPAYKLVDDTSSNIYHHIQNKNITHSVFKNKRHRSRTSDKKSLVRCYPKKRDFTFNDHQV